METHQGRLGPALAPAYPPPHRRASRFCQESLPVTWAQGQSWELPVTCTCLPLS